MQIRGIQIYILKSGGVRHAWLAAPETPQYRRKNWPRELVYLLSASFWRWRSHKNHNKLNISEK